jgi:hypothetical protein
MLYLFIILIISLIFNKVEYFSLIKLNNNRLQKQFLLTILTIIL